MNQLTKQLKQLGAAGLFGVGLACADVPTRPASDRPPVPQVTKTSLVVVGGDEYYDDGSGELIPTSSFSARLTNAQSQATISCTDTDCQAMFTASHEGNWHWSTQTLNYKILEGGTGTEITSGGPEETGGSVCTEKLAGIGPCINKKQENSLPVSAAVNGCSAKATLREVAPLFCTAKQCWITG